LSEVVTVSGARVVPSKTRLARVISIEIRLARVISGETRLAGGVRTMGSVTAMVTIVLCQRSCASSTLSSESSPD